MSILKKWAFYLCLFGMLTACFGQSTQRSTPRAAPDPDDGGSETATSSDSDSGGSSSNSSSGSDSSDSGTSGSSSSSEEDTEISSISVQPQEGHLPKGGGSLRLKITAVHAKSYQWFKNNAAILGATNSHFDASATGTYYCSVTGTDGVTHKSDEVDVKPHLKVFGIEIEPPLNISLSEGKQTTATSITVEFEDADSAQWEYSANNTAYAAFTSTASLVTNVNVAGEKATFQIPASATLTVPESGYFRLKITKAGADKFSTPMQLILNPIVSLTMVGDKVPSLGKSLQVSFQVEKHSGTYEGNYKAGKPGALDDEKEIPSFPFNTSYTFAQKTTEYRIFVKNDHGGETTKIVNLRADEWCQKGPAVGSPGDSNTPLTSFSHNAAKNSITLKWADGKHTFSPTTALKLAKCLASLNDKIINPAIESTVAFNDLKGLRAILPTATAAQLATKVNASKSDLIKQSLELIQEIKKDGASVTVYSHTSMPGKFGLRFKDGSKKTRFGIR